MVTEIYNGSGFPQLKKDIDETFAKAQKLKSVTVGVNLDNLLRPKEAGVVSLNDAEFTHTGLLKNFMNFAAKKTSEIHEVDYAVIEVGLGGRLDSTNIITPILSIITNISLDHTQFLGDTEEKIAAEKAGIIKKGVPVLLGEAEKRSVFDLFQNEARKAGAPFHYALSMGMLEVKKQQSNSII